MFARKCFNEDYACMKKLLKIPAVILIGSAFYIWVSYGEYIGISETLFPWLNFQGVFKQVLNYFIICMVGGLGALLWQLSGNKKEASYDED